MYIVHVLLLQKYIVDTLRLTPFVTEHSTSFKFYLCTLLVQVIRTFDPAQKLLYRVENIEREGEEGLLAWDPVGGFMLQNFIQSGENLVQLFIQVLLHRTKVEHFLFFKGPIFYTFKKCNKCNFVTFSKSIKFLFRMPIFCIVVHWGPY